MGRCEKKPNEKILEVGMEGNQQHRHVRRPLMPQNQNGDK
jgi:hypothetical protein